MMHGFLNAIWGFFEKVPPMDHGDGVSGSSAEAFCSVLYCLVFIILFLQVSAIIIVTFRSGILKSSYDVRFPYAHLTHKLFIIEEAFSRMAESLVIILKYSIL